MTGLRVVRALVVAFLGLLALSVQSVAQEQHYYGWDPENGCSVTERGNGLWVSCDITGVTGPILINNWMDFAAATEEFCGEDDPAYAHADASGQEYGLRAGAVVTWENYGSIYTEFRSESGYLDCEGGGKAGPNNCLDASGWGP